MSTLTIYKLPVVENTLILEPKILPELINCNNNGENLNSNSQKDLLEIASDESYKKGWDDATKHVENNAKKESDQLYKIFQDTIMSLKKERNDIWEQCEKEVVNLSLAIAKKAVYHEISNEGSKIIEKTIADTINMMKEKKILKLYLNPSDLEVLKQQKIPDTINPNGSYDIIADSKVSPGGCKFVTNYGNIDATIETRWNEIEAAFRDHSPAMENV